MNDFGRLRAMLDSLLSYHRKITMSKDEVCSFILKNYEVYFNVLF